KYFFKKRFMNFNLIASIVFISLSFACNTNNFNSKAPVIVELPPKKIADSSKTSEAGVVFNYDLKTPDHSWRLPDQLIEVSGNTWIDKDHLILIEDLHPDLYLIKIDDKNATLEKTIPFAEEDKEKIDIEDVTYVNNTVYALWSHGVIFKIADWNTKPQVEKIKTFLSKDNNTEGLCYDPVTRKLLVACKDASNVAEEKKSAKALYEFDMTQNKLNDQPFLLIHKKDFKKVTDQKLDFNPSAVAVHPITHDIYLLSTRDNKCMAVYSHDGKLKSFQLIDKDMMSQPEGICFSPEGKLYISSEGKKGEPGNLFEFDVTGK
ncbi:MAG: SdiA-regulated domain-containing protein, partial [Ginsengibacter sp.]